MILVKHRKRGLADYKEERHEFQVGFFWELKVLKRWGIEKASGWSPLIPGVGIGHTGKRCDDVMHCFQHRRFVSHLTPLPNDSKFVCEKFTEPFWWDPRSEPIHVRVPVLHQQLPASMAILIPVCFQTFFKAPRPVWHPWRNKSLPRSRRKIHVLGTGMKALKTHNLWGFICLGWGC